MLFNKFKEVNNIVEGEINLDIEIKELKNNPEWEIFNFFNNGIFRSKPASTGLTILQRCKN
mgnify:CR=1 FL=1